MSERLRALLRRQSSVSEGEGNVIEDLRQGVSLLDVITRRGIPPAAAQGIASFYELLEPTPRACDGTACHFASGHKPTGATVRCLGRCYAPPATDRDVPPPIPRQALGVAPIVLRHVLGESPVDPRTEYALPDGETILERLEASGLRGRGGAAYPTAAKWRAAREASGPVKWVVANGDEGDPGSYIDRLLLEEAPHAVLAGMLACAKAIGATHGVVYIRAEYPEAQVAVRAALEEDRKSVV